MAGTEGLMPRRGLFCRAVHRAAHLLGVNDCYIVTAVDDIGVVWTALRCHACGETSQYAPALGLEVPGRPPKPEDYS